MRQNIPEPSLTRRRPRGDHSTRAGVDRVLDREGHPVQRPDIGTCRQRSLCRFRRVETAIGDFGRELDQTSAKPSSSRR